MITPHWYQSDCLRAIRRAREKGAKEALIVMASGLGKTVTVAHDVLEFRKKNPKARVLFLCDKMETLRQVRTTFEVVNGSDQTYSFYLGKKKDAKLPQFVFAMLQTMRNNCKKFAPNEFDYVAVDESHHACAETYLDVVQYWKPKFLLGMTATPDRTDGQDICKVFGRPVFYLPIEEALAQDLLTSVDYHILTDEIKLPTSSQLHLGRLKLRKLNKQIFMPKRDEEITRIISRYIREVQNPRMIVFCESVEHSNNMAKFIPNALPYHSKISAEERTVRLGMFQSGLIPTLLVVDCFNEGVDVPPANVLVFLRSTSSPIIFLQQLGRGLRICEGKEKVLVLDFVANCERIKTVYDLWQEVKVKRERFLTRKPRAVRHQGVRYPGKPREPFVVDGGQANFHEKVVRLMDIVRRITDGYSKEEALQSLMDFASKLGRSPTQLEVHHNSDMPSLSFYKKNFGTFSETLVAAGLIPNRFDEVSKDELLDQLRKLTDELQHAPSQDEVAAASTAGKCSSEPVFRKHFESLNNAIEKIGHIPDRRVGMSKEELCEQLRKLHKKLGRIPGVEDLKESSAARETASYTAFRVRFKSWQRALKAAGLIDKAVETKNYSDTDLIQSLQKAKKLLGKTPTTVDIEKLRKAGKICSASVIVYYHHFDGGWANVLKAAGIEEDIH